MVDGTNGVRFTLRRPVGLHTGDLVEVVGYPELSGAAPLLRQTIARKTGHAPLPKPKNLSPMICPARFMIRPGCGLRMAGELPGDAH